MVFYIFGRLKIFFSWSIFVHWKYYEVLSSGDILSWNFEFVLTRYDFSLVQWLNIFLLFLLLLFLEWNFSTCGRPKRTKTVDLPMWSNGRKFKLWQSMDRFGRLTKIIYFGVNEWTDFWRWSIHLMNGFGRRTKNVKCGRLDRWTKVHL